MSLLPVIVQQLQTLDANAAVAQDRLAQRIEQYVSLIAKWNKVHNLTAIRDPHDMLTQHVMDSLVAVPHIHGPHVIDVGSGAGLPGIPMALAQPNWQVTLVESNQKKAAFLQQAKIELQLHNIQIMAQRIERIDASKPANTIVSRAFSELGQFLALTRQWASKENANCRWVAMKGNCSEQERNQVQAPFAVEKIVTLDVPGLHAKRQLVIMKHLCHD